MKSYSCGFFHSGSLASVTEGRAHQDVPHRCAARKCLVDVARCHDKTVEFSVEYISRHGFLLTA